MIDALCKDELLTPQDIRSYRDIINQRVGAIVAEGRFHYGALMHALQQPRRGWIVRGIPLALAETSLEHSDNLRRAGEAYCCNPESDTSIEIISPMFNAHDHVDAVFFDIIPGDDITPAKKKQMERYGVRQLYKALSNGLGNLFLANYERWEARTLREAQVGFSLDKQCAATRAQEYRNNFDEIVAYYEAHVGERTGLLQKYPDAKDLDEALDMLYGRLGEFYVVNQSRITDPFFRRVADAVEDITALDAYPVYFDMLSTMPIKE